MDWIAAKEKKSGIFQKISHLYYEHKLALLLSYHRLFRQKFQVIGAVILIGLAMALCMGFSFIAKISYQAQIQLQSSPAVTVFPKSGLNNRQSQQLIERLKEIPGLNEVQLIEAKTLGEGLLEDELPDTFWHSLPNLLTANLSNPQMSQVALNDLHLKIAREPLVAHVEIDYTWQHQVKNLMNLGQAITWIVGIVLIASVVLMINYSIRLLLEKHKQEISVLYDLGATSSFIQRPYLYQGLLLGLLGAFFAVTFLCICYGIIKTQLNEFSELFHFSLCLTDLDLKLMIQSLLFVVVFAWLCSYTSTKKWLKLFEQQLTH